MIILLAQLKVQVLWLENFIGLAIDQRNKKQKYPLTSYYLWPKTEAWEQLNLELEAKPWLTKKEKVTILNRTAELMNYWRQYRNIDSMKTTSKNSPK